MRPASPRNRSYSEAINTRGLEQLIFVYEKLQAQPGAWTSPGAIWCCWTGVM